MRETWSWAEWTDRWYGGPDEDLSTVLTKVKVHTLRATQAKWARDWRTRAFCDLGMHLLYEHHFNGEFDPEKKLFRNLGPEDLMRHAAVMVPDADQAEALDKQRWVDTWYNQPAYIEDLISYLFRSAPTLRRVSEVQGILAEVAQELTLGELIRQGSRVELNSTLKDPTVGLQTFVQAAMPNQRQIQTAVRRIESEMISQWAKLYSQLIAAYGVKLRPGVSSQDLAELFDTAIEGTLLRARSLGKIPLLSSGESTLSASILTMLPNLCDISPEEIEIRELNSPIVAT